MQQGGPGRAGHAMSTTVTVTGQRGDAVSAGTEQLRGQVSRKIRLVNVAQLAAATGMNPRSIWRRVKSGDLPKPFRFGGRAVWREADIESVIRKAAGAEAE